MPILETKAHLRREIRALLKHKTPEERAAASAQARQLLEKQSIWQRAGTIFFYAPMPEELDIWPLVSDSLAAGKVCCLPRFDAATNRYLACQVDNLGEGIEHGNFGIREPRGDCVAVPLNRLDLTLVPGVAFDSRGRRLGRGKGFYDQLLADVRGTTCGVAFDEQIVAEIPIEPHDIHLNCILTPTRWIQP